jgi:hypothetical protein
MSRPINPAHPFIEAVVGQMTEVRADGTLSATAIGALEAGLAGLSREALADALWHGLVFASFLDTKLGADGSAAQLLSLVEAHAARLPAAMREALDVARPDAKRLGREESLVPVGSAPTPAGAVRGGIAARLAADKYPPKA